MVFGCPVRKLKRPYIMPEVRDLIFLRTLGLPIAHTGCVRSSWLIVNHDGMMYYG